MLEYASIRLTFVCTTPTTVPTIIVTAAMTDSTGIHCAWSGSSGDRNTRDERRKRGRLDAGRHERRDDRRRAFVGVRRPHVERHRRHLEREADGQQADREQRDRARRRRRPARDSASPISSMRVEPDSANAKATP